MEIQNFILDHYRPLLLIAGILFLFLGIMPIISEKYYHKNLESKWDKKIWPFSERDGYIYGRYIRQIYPILMGITLVGIAIYKFLNP